MNRMGPDYRDNAVQKMKQAKRDELMDDGFKLSHELYRPFVPNGIEKVRLVPGEEAERLQTMATMASIALEYQETRARRWFQTHGWTQNYLTDVDGNRTIDPRYVKKDKAMYVREDKEGFLFYWVDKHGLTVNPPAYLKSDFSGIQFYIYSTLSIMTSTKVEQLIETTYETPERSEMPLQLPVPQRTNGQASKEVESI